jgi:hypothetical protein
MRSLGIVGGSIVKEDEMNLEIDRSAFRGNNAIGFRRG